MDSIAQCESTVSVMDASWSGRCAPEDLVTKIHVKEGPVTASPCNFSLSRRGRLIKPALLRRTTHGYVAKVPDRHRDPRPRCVGRRVVLERGHCAASGGGSTGRLGTEPLEFARRRCCGGASCDGAGGRPRRPGWPLLGWHGHHPIGCVR